DGPTNRMVARLFAPSRGAERLVRWTDYNCVLAQDSPHPGRVDVRGGDPEGVTAGLPGLADQLDAIGVGEGRRAARALVVDDAETPRQLGAVVDVAAVLVGAVTGHGVGRGVLPARRVVAGDRDPDHDLVADTDLTRRQSVRLEDDRGGRERGDEN